MVALAANRSGRTLAASIPGSSDNTDVRVNASGVPPVSTYTTDDRVNASGVLALSPVDVRMHASDETTTSASSGVVYSPAVESPASSQSQLVDSGTGEDLLPASMVFPSVDEMAAARRPSPSIKVSDAPDMEAVMDAVQLVAPADLPQLVPLMEQTAATMASLQEEFMALPAEHRAVAEDITRRLLLRGNPTIGMVLADIDNGPPASSSASTTSTQRDPAMIASSIAEAESLFLDGGSSPVTLTANDMPLQHPGFVRQDRRHESTASSVPAAVTLPPADGYASDSSDSSADSTTSLGRILQDIRRNDRHGITPDSGPTLQAPTWNDDDPLPPAQDARVQARPTAMEAVLLRMGVLQLNADGLRIINPAAASAGTIENLFVECLEAQLPPTAIGAVSLVGDPVSPSSAPATLPAQQVDPDSDTALHHRAVMQNPLQYGDSGVERQRDIARDYRRLKAERDARLSAPGPPPSTDLRVTFNAGNTVPGTFPLPALPTGTPAVPSRIPDPAWVDEVSILREARSTTPGIFDHVPLPTNPYSVKAAVAAVHYDREGIARHGFEPYADVGMTPAVSRDPYRRQGDMFSHLSPSGPQELWDEAIRHQHSLQDEGGASTVASPLSKSRISREPDRPYTPAAHRTARNARSSLVSIADPSKISRDRVQDAVYATATGTVPLPISPVIQDLGEKPPPLAADVQVNNMRPLPGGAATAGPTPTYRLVGGLPYVEGIAVRVEHHHRRFPLPDDATFTYEDVAREPGLLSTSEEAEHRAIIRCAMERATALGWSGQGPHPELGLHSEMERDLQQLQMRRLFRDAKSASDKRRILTLGIYPDGSVDNRNLAPSGGQRAGSYGGYDPNSTTRWLSPAVPTSEMPPPPTMPANEPMLSAALQSSSSSTLGAKLVGELSKLDTFSDNPTDWLDFKDAIFRVAGVNDLEHVLAPGYYQDPRFNTRDNKLMYFLLQRAVTGTVDAILHFRKAPAMDGHAAYFELYNAYTLAAPAQSAILLQKLTLFRMKTGERLNAFCSRLVKLFDDLDRLPGEYRMTHNPTQRLGYLLTAIRNEEDLKETYVYIEQAMTRGDMTFDLAVRALGRRCETLQAARALEDGAGGRRQGFAAVHGEEDSDTGTALFSSANKRLNGGNDNSSTDFKDGTACLVKDCPTLCLMPICPIHYAEMVCGKTPRLTLKRNWGEATYDVKARRTNFPAAVPDDFRKRVKVPSKRTRTRGKE